jgi:inner membrane protein
MSRTFSWSDWLLYPYWFWFAIGGLLLSGELLGASGYLLWLGLSAWLVMLMSWLMPAISWPWLWAHFSLLSFVTLLGWQAWQQRKSDLSTPTELLNQPQQQLLGYQATIEAPLIDGIGRLRVGDSSWRIQADQPLSAGTQVVVISIEGITLRVKPL